VVLHATTENRKGVSVSGLEKDNFQVFEDGVAQRIEHFSHEDIPVTVGLVVDGSGSMRPKHADVITAGKTFVQSSNDKDEMFVVNFNEHVSFGLPENELFTNKITPMQLAIERSPISGETALYDAISAALERLKLGKHDKKVLIVISDGGDNASKHKLNEIMTQAVDSNAVIYTIGLFDESDMDRNPGVLKQLAHATGGEFFQPATIAEVIPICAHIARDIRSQYTIAYTPTNATADGAFRNIQVKAKAPGEDRLLVRTRTGYYAPGGHAPAKPPRSHASPAHSSAQQ
jgi:Ca-activated chloride channel family protein